MSLKPKDTAKFYFRKVTPTPNNCPEHKEAWQCRLCPNMIPPVYSAKNWILQFYATRTQMPPKLQRRNDRRQKQRNHQSILNTCFARQAAQHFPMAGMVY
ncbi:hypothetical protein GEMRC1_010860 [Eukaryota sp. GEM-RC1]